MSGVRLDALNRVASVGVQDVQGGLVMDFREPHATLFRRGDPDAPNKLAIAICSLGAVRIEHEIMLLGVGMPLGQALAFIPAVGYGIQDARNIAWAGAEGAGYEYLMFWDDDVMPLAGHAAETLLETMDQNPEIDILGGVYPQRGFPAPIVALDSSLKPWWGWEDGGIHKVWMTGTGFTIYRMSSIKKLDAPVRQMAVKDGKGNPATVREYFRIGTSAGATDDYVLAKDAEQAGLSWYVHGGVVCDQLELSGLRYEIKNARQRIGGKDEGSDKGTDNAGNNDRGPAGVRARNGRSADVPAGGRRGGRPRTGATTGR
jgi:hypothetical protein